MSILLVYKLLFLLIHCINCQVNKDIVMMWTSRTKNGYGVTRVMFGDPRDYTKVNRSSDSNMFQGWTAQSRTTQYQSITYRFKSDMVAMFESSSKAIKFFKLNKYLNKSMKFYDNFIHLPMSETVPSLALASKYNFLYWVDLKFQYIGVIQFKKRYWTRLIDSNLDRPNYIVVHEARRFIFWSDAGRIPKIERSNIFGEERTVIIKSNIIRPINLVIDQEFERLYWLDGDLKSCDFDGNNIKSYQITSENGRVTNFVKYKDIVVFGTDSGFFENFKISKNNDLSYISTVDNDANILYSTLESRKDTNIPDPCSPNNCNHICFPQNQLNYTCGCSFGFTIGPDGRTCNPASIRGDQLLVGDILQSAIYQVDPISGKTEAILNFYPKQLTDIAYLEYLNESYIYYVLDGGYDINRYIISNATNSVVFLASNINDLVADQTTGDIYFSHDTGMIGEVTFNRDYRLIVKTNAKIEKIYIHPTKRRLFYSQCGLYYNYVIEIDLETLIETYITAIDKCVRAMAFDFDAGIGYFWDVSYNLIQYDLENMIMKKTTERSFNEISDMVLYNEFLYLVDGSNYVEKVHSQTWNSSMLTRPYFTRASEILFMKLNSTSTGHSKSSQTSMPIGMIMGLSVGGCILLLIPTRL